MTTIWFILALMTGAAVLALLWPISRRPKAAGAGTAVGLATQARFYEDQIAEIERDLSRGLIAPAEAEAARAEAARRFLRASREEEPEAERADASAIAEPHLRQRRAASAFALSTIPLVALLVYGHYGKPNLPAQTEADRKAVVSGGQELMAAIGQIEARLASDPNDARGWAVIAPVYARLGRFGDAARAYEAVVRLKGEDADRLSSWGEALVAAEEGRITPQARGLFERALAIDPRMPKTQFYLARADEQAGDMPAALRRLDALVAQGPADAPWMGLVREALARLKPLAPPSAPATSERQADEAVAAATSKPVEAPAPGAGSTPPAATPPEAQVAVPKSMAEKPPAQPTDPMPSGAAADAIKAMPPAEREAAIRSMVAGLDSRLAAKGGSASDWMRLVRSYSALGERMRAVAALDRARMALAADPRALTQLDALGRELDLRTVAARP